MNTAAELQREDTHHSIQPATQSRPLLVIEDDPCVLDFIGHALDVMRPDTGWDYATTAEDAMELIRLRSANGREPRPYGLVIADIFLDGDLTGFDTWLECAREFPTMPFVITSSLSIERYLSILSGFDRCPTFMPKPLTVGGLQSVFREHLDKEPLP